MKCRGSKSSYTVGEWLSQNPNSDSDLSDSDFGAHKHHIPETKFTRTESLYLEVAGDSCGYIW